MLYLLGGGIVAVTILAGYSYYQGRQDGWASAQLAVQREINRQIQVQTEVQKRYQKEISDLLDKNEALDLEMEKLREEADNDPGASDCGISPGGVQRLNRIK